MTIFSDRECHAFSMTTLQLRSLASRLWGATPSLTRSINSKAAFVQVSTISDSDFPLIPQIRSNHLESIKSPADFLKAIGRSCESKISVESWEDFWKKDGPSLKKDGVSVRDRRYVFKLMFEDLNSRIVVTVHSCSDIFCGAWRNIAWATQLENLLMNYLLKRRYEGKSFSILHLVIHIQVFPPLDGGLRSKTENGYALDG